MKKATKVWLTIAALLLAAGLIIFAGGMSILKWDFTKLSSDKYETNSHPIVDEYSDISIVTDIADVEFVISGDSSTSVVCYERINGRHSVSVKDGKLVIELENTKKWYEYIGISLGRPKITVTLPRGEYGTLNVKTSTGKVDIPSALAFENIDMTASTGAVTSRASVTGGVKIKTTTGKITLEDISTGALDLSVSTGNVVLNNVDCGGDINIKVSTGKTEITDTECVNLTSNGSTGSMILTDVIASGKFSLKRSTGDVRLERCDAAELHIKIDTGSVKGSLLSEKVFVAESDTGHINVPKTTSGGVCEISTNTGNINITVE